MNIGLNYALGRETFAAGHGQLSPIENRFRYQVNDAWAWTLCGERVGRRLYR